MNSATTLGIWRDGPLPRRVETLLLAVDAGHHRMWEPVQVQLLGDRLTLRKLEDEGGPIQYIPLDRISMRPRPRGYKPYVGVHLLDARVVSGKPACHRVLRGASPPPDAAFFSIQCGIDTFYFAAPSWTSAKVGAAARAKLGWKIDCFARVNQEWVGHIVRAWEYCFQTATRYSLPDLAPMPDPAEQASLGIRLETALAGLLAHLKRQEDALQEVSASTAQDGSGLLSADLSRGLADIHEELHELKRKVDNLNVSASEAIPPPALIERDKETRELGDGIYTIAVQTSDLAQAGTSGSVSIRLQGLLGTTPWVALPSQPGDFSQGQCALFQMSFPYVGPIHTLGLELHGVAPGEEWLLDCVTVTPCSTGATPGP